MNCGRRLTSKSSAGTIESGAVRVHNIKIDAPRTPMRIRLLVILFSASLAAFGQNGGSSGQHWIATWVAAQQQPRTPPAAQAAASKKATARPAPPIAFNHQTVRMIVHTSIGGKRVRIQLSNTFGTAPLAVGAAHIALHGKESAIVPGSDRALMFNGKPSCLIPAAATMVSDPVDLDVPAQGDLAVSVYVPGDTGPATTHSLGLHTTFISKQGDATGEPALADTITSLSWYWLSSVDVLAPAQTAAIMTMGDSITDGYNSTPNTDSSWPSFLARRLAAKNTTSNLALLNQGISGNRLLRDQIGPNALSRLERDVLSQPGVKWLLVLEGINDIGSAFGNGALSGAFGPKPTPPPTEEAMTEDLIGAYRQIIGRAHDHGIKVAGGTLTPYEGAAYYSESGNKVRQAVNRWIRTGGAFDAVIDFDAVTGDPEHTNRFRPALDSGDHLHPGDAGYKAMAEAIDLSMFTSSRAGSAENSRSRIR